MLHNLTKKSSEFGSLSDVMGNPDHFCLQHPLQHLGVHLQSCPLRIPKWQPHPHKRTKHSKKRNFFISHIFFFKEEKLYPKPARRVSSLSLWLELYHMVNPKPDAVKGSRIIMVELGESGFTGCGGGITPPTCYPWKMGSASSWTKLGFSSWGKKWLLDR